MASSKSRLAIGFVVYFPPLDLQDRLQMLSNKEFSVYVYDNSPEESAFRTDARAHRNVKYMTSGKNRGLGAGMSSVCAQAYYDSFDGLLFFDQDTIFDEKTIDFVTKFFREGDLHFATGYTAIVFTSDLPSSHPVAFDIKDVMLAVSSGSLFFLKNLKNLGWHNETYFVDGVDYELCLRSLAGGFKIGKCAGTPGFDHISGQPDKIITILGKSLPVRRYSAARIIDTTRSYSRLVCSSLLRGQFKFAGLMLRAYGIYALGQSLARIILK